MKLFLMKLACFALGLFRLALLLPGFFAILIAHIIGWSSKWYYRLIERMFVAIGLYRLIVKIENTDPEIILRREKIKKDMKDRFMSGTRRNHEETY